MDVRKRLEALRDAMRSRGIAYYLIPTADFHGSEYVSDYFKVREYFSGFTGSNGTLLVWQEGAGLWTDGRYFIQAQKELEGSGITLYRMMTEGVPTIQDFLCSQMSPGQVLGFDGRVMSAKQGLEMEQALEKCGATIYYDCDLAGELLTNRPALPCEKAFVLPGEIVGLPPEDKLAQVRQKLKEEGADGLFLSKLDDIMWLYNIRGFDVECNPVALSYAYITGEEAVVFLQPEAVPKEVSEHLRAHGVRVKDYGKVIGFLEELPGNQTIWADGSSVCLSHWKKLEERNRVLEKRNPTERLKAVKNPTELAKMEEYFLLDSVAVTKFIYWLKTNMGKQKITEVSAVEYLDRLRSESPGFLELSFPTISGYGANGAMMHYEATEENHATLEPKGFLLVDSGGQYLGATTDVTRTIALGALTEEERKHYTLTATGMLAMSHAVFLQGCTGRNLDILARAPLWRMGIDYLCGTGHGVGYILNVHEGPQGLRWRYNKSVEEAVLEPGMVVTNEPGVYIEGSHGIRIENVLQVEKDVHNEYGQFLHFKTLTWVPLDLDAVDWSLLTDEVREQILDYQKQVYEKLSPYLNEEEQKWLYKECIMH